jgi:hypothetical protein
MALRIVSFFVMLFSILFFPFWVSIVLAILGMIYFAFLWETIALFLLSDLLYGTREGKNPPLIFISFIISAVLLIIIEIVKKKLKFYS